MSVSTFGQIIDIKNSWNDLEIEIPMCEKSTNCTGTFYTTHSYHLGKETIIDDNEYYTLIDTSYEVGRIGIVNNFYFIREDSSHNKVYYLYARDYKRREILLYDFGIKKDSIFKMTIFDNQNELHPFDTINKSAVIEIDSVIYYGVKRKRIKFDNNMEWIEGIGSKFGFIYDYQASSYNETLPRFLLLCFKQNDVIKYKNDFDYDCIYTGPKESIETSEDYNLEIYPNPVSNRILTIRSNKVIKSIEIFNLCGIKIGNFSPNSNSYVIQLTNFQKGLYIIKVNDIFKKIIVE